MSGHDALHCRNAPIPRAICLEALRSVHQRYGLHPDDVRLSTDRPSPLISRVLPRSNTPKVFRMANEQERDLSLAKWSFWFVFLGFFTMAATPSLAVFILGLLVLAIGSGYSSFVHSLMSLYVDPLHQSRLFSLVGMVEVAGNLYGLPMLAGLFTLGIRLGGGGVGIPYYRLAALAALCINVVFYLFIRELYRFLVQSIDIDRLNK